MLYDHQINLSMSISSLIAYLFSHRGNRCHTIVQLMVLFAEGTGHAFPLSLICCVWVGDLDARPGWKFDHGPVVGDGLVGVGVHCYDFKIH